MTLSEAIIHAEEVAYQKDLESEFETDNERYAMTDNERANCKKCADEHRQLAEWLKELKAYKEQSGDVISRQTAINEIARWKGYLDADMIMRIQTGINRLPSAQPERENESVGCNGCRYDWFGDPRCNRCARSFQDYYEANMRGE